MIKELQLRLPPEQAAEEQKMVAHIARELAIDRRSITAIRVLRRSIDARQRMICVNMTVRVYINEEPDTALFTPIAYRDVSSAQRIIIVGAGPAGLFAALRAIELGMKPIVLERGKDVHERKKDTSLITRNIVNAESNYCFGEGGAGAYSDGKLYTRSKKRGSVEKILRVFCQHGAPTAILSDAHPHIGTDRLPRVIENIRKTILHCGGEVHFNTKMLRLIIANNRCVGCEAQNMVTAAEETFRGPVILAVGHSARDVYSELLAEKINIESKALAIGVRLEHPSELIDEIQYHGKRRGDYLPAAEYNFTTQVDGRGVYSFCMCPGGFVIPAATSQKEIVVNGMSTASRSSQWSNAGMVVELRQDDILASNIDMPLIRETSNPLLMVEFQQWLEKTTWQQGNRRQTAPAQRMDDFVNGRLSYNLPRSSYSPGLISSPLHSWLPSFISSRLRSAFRTFGQSSRGFLTTEAVVIAAETRTSSPVRILRDDTTLQHIRIAGLFPCGEGAGYAGGIVSSAIDGERCAEATKNYLTEKI